MTRLACSLSSARPPRRHRTLLAASTLGMLLSLPACGGGSPGDAQAQSVESDTARREAAASLTATTHRACAEIRPFHWSIGDASGVRAQGRVGADAPTAQTVMPIASASKLVYGAYVTQVRRGALTREDVKLLNFTSGYTEFDLCLRHQTVAECQSRQGRFIRNGSYVPEHDGLFHYSGGHMQKHATLMGLGNDNTEALAAHVSAGLDGVMQLDYGQPQPAGGVHTSAAQYGRLLQQIVAGRLHMREMLGKHAVCATPALCASAISSPVKTDERFDYSIGHWVESDPVRGDGAFSSAGAFGFYPWIDASRQWWGIVARHSTEIQAGTGQGMRSMACGREIRAAWLKAVTRP